MALVARTHQEAVHDLILDLVQDHRVQLDATSSWHLDVWAEGVEFSRLGGKGVRALRTIRESAILSQLDGADLDFPLLSVWRLQVLQRVAGEALLGVVAPELNLRSLGFIVD